MKKEKKIKYTIEEIENIANTWSWKNPQNRRDYPIIIDFLCEIDPAVAKRYKFDPYAKLSIGSKRNWEIYGNDPTKKETIAHCAVRQINFGCSPVSKNTGSFVSCVENQQSRFTISFPRAIMGI